MFLHMHAVILAGGLGSRLWPLSRGDFPKQMLHLFGGDSLLKGTLARVMGCSFVGTIVVSTSMEIESFVRAELAGMDVRILVEPCRRGTGPAIGFAVRYLREVCGVGDEDPILVLPSDHVVEPAEVFIESVGRCLATCLGGQLVVFGIRPAHAETGYGYVRVGESVDGFCRRVEEFVEKPDLARAREYLADGRYYWNSGMMLFTARIFWAEVRAHCPSIGVLEACAWKGIELVFEGLAGISIDYALLEKSRRIALCPLPVFWRDVGCWASVYEMGIKDENLNVISGQVLGVNTRGCLIMGGSRVISAIGLEDLVIVDTDDALLICRKGDSQRVACIPTLP